MASVLDIFEGLRVGVRDAVEAAPVGDKSLLELTLGWEELAPDEKEAAERLRVFLVPGTRSTG